MLSTVRPSGAATVAASSPGPSSKYVAASGPPVGSVRPETASRGKMRPSSWDSESPATVNAASVGRCSGAGVSDTGDSGTGDSGTALRYREGLTGPGRDFSC